MDKSKANYISVIGSRLVAPIFTLLDCLLAKPHPGSNAVQTGARENGYSLSLCLLLVVLLESMLARARSIVAPERRGDVRRPLDFLAFAYPDCPFLDDVEELFVLRDVIAHNHIWRVQFSQEPDDWMKLIEREIDEASGDKKFAKAVDFQAGITKRLKLKVIPTQIDRYDVEAVLRVALETIRFVDDRENGRLAIANLNGPFAKEILDIREVAQRLQHQLTRR
jgi:hypothetical protein